jgi:membrane protein DedA with SNARE-associated domain
LGVWLAERWELVHHYSKYLDYIVVLGVIVFLVYWIKKRLAQKKNTSKNPA